MGKILNVTNGDSAVNIMKEAGIPGDIVPWRDVLHDGPVPGKLPLKELSDVRAQFIAEQGWEDIETVRQSFRERDKQLESSNKYDEVILWFEHDLYDQLQILQLLDWFAENAPEHSSLSIICTEQYLGMASPDQMKSLVKFKENITNEHLNLAKKAWNAFRCPSHEELQYMINEDLSLLPFLKDAIFRLLEEYPSTGNGLSRTAQKALQIISRGERRPGRIFGYYQDSEERKFMGDSSFWKILHQLLESEPPLIKLPAGKQLTLPTSPDQELTITKAGTEVMNN